MPAIEAAFSRATRREATGLSLLGGVDNAALEQVASSSSAGIPLVLLGAGVAHFICFIQRCSQPSAVAVVALAVLHLVDDDAAFEAGVASSGSAATALDNHAQGLLDGATDDLDAELLVFVLGLHVVEALCGADEGGAATGEEEVPVALR